MTLTFFLIVPVMIVLYVVYCHNAHTVQRADCHVTGEISADIKCSSYTFSCSYQLSCLRRYMIISSLIDYFLWLEFC